MKKVIINMGDIQHKLLEKFADKNGMPPDQYATNIVVSWINSHLEGAFIKKMKSRTFEQMEDIFGEAEP